MSAKIVSVQPVRASVSALTTACSSHGVRVKTFALFFILPVLGDFTSVIFACCIYAIALPYSQYLLLQTVGVDWQTELVLLHCLMCLLLPTCIDVAAATTAHISTHNTIQLASLALWLSALHTGRHRDQSDDWAKSELRIG